MKSCIIFTPWTASSKEMRVLRQVFHLMSIVVDVRSDKSMLLLPSKINPRRQTFIWNEMTHGLGNDVIISIISKCHRDVCSRLTPSSLNT